MVLGIQFQVIKILRLRPVHTDEPGVAMLSCGVRRRITWHNIMKDYAWQLLKVLNNCYCLASNC